MQMVNHEKAITTNRAIILWPLLTTQVHKDARAGMSLIMDADAIIHQELEGES